VVAADHRQLQFALAQPITSIMMIAIMISPIRPTAAPVRRAARADRIGRKLSNPGY
jgi:hypothetical protein